MSTENGCRNCTVKRKNKRLSERIYSISKRYEARPEPMRYTKQAGQPRISEAPPGPTAGRTLASPRREERTAAAQSHGGQTAWFKGMR
jgi:hypothetical protein